MHVRNRPGRHASPKSATRPAVRATWAVGLATTVTTLVVALIINPSAAHTENRDSVRSQALATAVVEYAQRDRALQATEGNLGAYLSGSSSHRTSTYTNLTQVYTAANTALSVARAQLAPFATPTLNQDALRLWGDHTQMAGALEPSGTSGSRQQIQGVIETDFDRFIIDARAASSAR